MKPADGCSGELPGLGEHQKKVFERLVLVKETMAKGGGYGDMHFALATLIKSFEYCAAVEEALMLRHGYPGYEPHKKQHVDLLSSLRALETMNLSTGLTEKMIGAAFASMMRHHLTQDRPYARYLP